MHAAELSNNLDRELSARVTPLRPNYFRVRCFFVLLVAAVLTVSATFADTTVQPGRTQQLNSPDAVPEGLKESDWSSIRAASEQSRHAVVPLPNRAGHQARNPGQQWRTRFDGRGFTTQPEAAGWQWGMELQSYGFRGHERAVTGSPRVSTAGQRLAYDWDATLQEWFVNDSRGLEHGFTMRERPTGAPSLNSEPSTLTFTLAVRGGLRPEVETDRRGVRFVDAQGAAVLTYAGLTVFDADGRKLPARFESVEKSKPSTPNTQHPTSNELTTAASTLEVRCPTFDIVCSQSESTAHALSKIINHHPSLINLVVDERGARYPLTIDPLAQQAYLKAYNSGQNDQFGYSVAISGDTVVVGAPNESSNGIGVNDHGNASNDLALESGAAYVFVRNGTNWSQQAYLKASNPGMKDGFGTAVAISGDTVVVGAPRNNPGGSTYVFVRVGANWSQQELLKASNAGGNFGVAVSVSSNTVVAGADSEHSNGLGVDGNQTDYSSTNSGAAYVFVRSGATWTQQAYLKASNAGAGDGFGASVGVSGDTVVVGAYGESSNATGVNGDGGNNDAFLSGAAYIFARAGTTWGQQAYLKASNTGASDNFGHAVAVSGDTVVVAAPSESSSATGVNGEQNDDTGFSSGAAYVFVRNDANWTQQAYLKASNTGVGDQFGRAVAVSDNTVVIGAHFESSNATGVNDPTGQANNSAYGSGAAYVFLRTGTNWNQQAYVKASNTGAGSHPSDVGDNFGYAVGVSGDTMVAGAPREGSDSNAVNGNQSDDSARAAGAAYTFSNMAPPNAPEIAVEQPAGVNLSDGTAIVDYGVVPVGSSRDLTFIITNIGNADLTGLSLTLDGANASDFTVIADPAPSVSSAGNTSFTVRFAPGVAGFRSARLHLASNDSNENPFDITLTSVPTAPEYIITAFAGTGVAGFNGDGVPATNAQLYCLRGVAVDSSGNVYIADDENHRVRRVDTNGIITTIAGTGMPGFFGDGSAATNAQLNGVRGVSLDNTGNVYIADVRNNRVRRVGTNGIITTFAGNGDNVFSGDGGLATQAGLSDPNALAVDSAGNVFIANPLGDRIRRVDTNGLITTFAGNGNAGFSGDGGLATQAQLNDPRGVAVDSAGNILIADYQNHRVRRVDPNGIITTVAGSGNGGFRGDGGLATQAHLRAPQSVAVDGVGNILIADTGNYRVRRVDTNGVIATVAGNGRRFGSSGDGGPARAANVDVNDVTMDVAGNILLSGNYQVWRLKPTGAVVPLRPIYASTPAPGTLRFPDTHVDAGDPAELTLFIGNDGAADLHIQSIGLTSHNGDMAIIGSPSLFPHRIPTGSRPEAIELTITWNPSRQELLLIGLQVISDDPVTPVANYYLAGRATGLFADPAEFTFLQLLSTSTNLFKPPGQQASRARRTLARDGTQTATFNLDSNATHSLTAEVPSFLGGGSVQLSNFTGSVTVSLLPIPNDFERAFIRVESGSFTAPSIRLPSGLDTGLNQLTFGPPEQSGGILFLTNGSYTAYATARIVNNLIPAGVTVRGNYSGSYNAEKGEINLQSQSRDLFEPSDRVLFNHSANGLWLTWANTNALEEATNILGAWRAVTNAASPYRVDPTKKQQQFFRLRQTVP